MNHHNRLTPEAVSTPLVVLGEILKEVLEEALGERGGAREVGVLADDL